MHHERGNREDAASCLLLTGPPIHLLEGELNCFLVLPSKIICRTCGKTCATFGASKGRFQGIEQTRVMEENLLRVRDRTPPRSPQARCPRRAPRLVVWPGSRLQNPGTRFRLSRSFSGMGEPGKLSAGHTSLHSAALGTQRVTTIGSSLARRYSHKGAWQPFERVQLFLKFQHAR